VKLLPVIPAASKEPTMDTTQVSGKTLTGPVKVDIPKFAVEPGKLYEFTADLKVTAKDFGSAMVVPAVNFLCLDQYVDGTPGYWGVVDTRNYPNGVRKIMTYAVPPKGTTDATISFELKGECSVTIDNIKLLPLDLSKI
jgi:hypothetical protein